MNHTGCWVWDVRSGAPVYWSAEMFQICGRDPAQGLPSEIEYCAIHRPRDWSVWLAAVRNAVRERKDLNIECRFVLTNGDVKQVRITGRPIAGMADEVTEIIGSATEIDELGAEDPTPSPAEMIDLIPGLVWSARPDGSNEYCNGTWLDYTGLTAETAMNRGWTDAIHLEDRERLTAYWADIVSSGEVGEIEARLRRFDGEYRWFLFRAKPQRDGSGTIVKWYGTTTDIEDRKRAEDALRASELNFRLIVDTIPALVCTMAPTGELEVVNQQILEYFGKTRDELKDWASIGVVHEDDLVHVTAQWRYSIGNEHPYDVEHRIRRSDGVYRWFHVRGFPLRDAQGHIVRWHILLVDIDDRKQTEDALRDSEQNLRLIVDTIPGFTWIMSTTGEVQTVNRQMREYFGKTQDELKDSLQYIHPADRERVIAYWSSVVESGQPFEIEHRLRRADGVYRWFQSRGRPLRDDEGRILRWYNLITDIEDQKHAEEALRESERELRQLVDHVPGYIATANSRGEHDYANKRLVDYTGALNQETAGLGFINTIHPDDQELVKTEWLRCASSGQPMDLQHRLRRFDGVYRWFHVRVDPYLDNNGSVIRWYGLLTDIDDGKRAEEAVRTSETRLRLITEAIPAILTSRDAQGTLDYVNQQLEDYTGMSAQEIIESGVALIHPDDRESLLRVWRVSQESGERYELDYRMLGADGEYRWFQVRGAPLVDRDGRVLRWYAVISDIEEAKRAREALFKSQTRLARMTQITTIAELSASIAHEINQPLASVVANGHACVAWLSVDSPNLERARIAAERMIRDGNAAAEVVRRIRALFKQAPPAPALSDTNEIVREALKLIDNEILDSGTAVETELTAGLPMVVVDRVQIQQCLINLVRNAIDAMDDVGDGPKALLLITRHEGVNILIQIRDTGCGIVNPAAIFDPFFTTKESGMGMGLAICRSIVETHDGRLWATQNDGAGTTFSFTLPLQPEGAV